MIGPVSPMGQRSQGRLSGENDTFHQLIDMITRLGSQWSSGAVGGSSHTDVPAQHVSDTQHSAHNSHAQPISIVSALGENTSINVIVKADKGPAIFGG